jgi:hypothetical protein
MEVCVGKMEGNPEEIEFESEHQEVPKKEAIVETVGALEDLYGDQYVAIGRH